LHSGLHFAAHTGSSHCQWHKGKPSSIEHEELHPSLFSRLSSSHCSLALKIPSPHLFFRRPCPPCPPCPPPKGPPAQGGKITGPLKGGRTTTSGFSITSLFTLCAGNSAFWAWGLS